MWCSYCGSHEHPTTLCPKTWNGSSARVNLRCTYCGSRYHDTRFCRKTSVGEYNPKREPDGDYLD